MNRNESLGGIRMKIIFDAFNYSCETTLSIYQNRVDGQCGFSEMLVYVKQVARLSARVVIEFSDRECFKMYITIVIFWNVTPCSLVDK